MFLIIMIKIFCVLCLAQVIVGVCWCLFMSAPPLCTLTVVISSGLCKGESLQFPLFTPVEFVVRISSFGDEKFKHGDVSTADENEYYIRTVEPLKQYTFIDDIIYIPNRLAIFISQWI